MSRGGLQPTPDRPLRMSVLARKEKRGALKTHVRLATPYEKLADHFNTSGGLELKEVDLKVGWVLLGPLPEKHGGKLFTRREAERKDKSKRVWFEWDDYLPDPPAREVGLWPVKDWLGEVTGELRVLLRDDAPPAIKHHAKKKEDETMRQTDDPMERAEAAPNGNGHHPPAPNGQPTLPQFDDDLGEVCAGRDALNRVLAKHPEIVPSIVRDPATGGYRLRLQQQVMRDL